MSGEAGSSKPTHYYIDEKWDAAIDTTLRRVVYGGLAGGVAALALFRGPSSRAAALAFGAGFGAGSAYHQNQAVFEELLKTGSSSK